jgi:hypothetical protein
LGVIVRLWGVLSACACHDGEPSTVASPSAQSTPGSDDRGALCADLGSLRVCFRGPKPSLVSRKVPSGAAPPEGFRCGGMAAARRCEDRRRNGSAFVCGAEACVQERPRMPDDGEWECVEMTGIVFCRSRGDAAGIARGPSDLGWLCGARRGAADGERVCVDLDPDRPRPSGAFACSFVYAHGAAQRVCRITRRPLVGSACGALRSCPDGLSCVAEHCLPPCPVPACWLDADCGLASRCRWGTCGEGAS